MIEKKACKCVSLIQRDAPNAIEAERDIFEIPRTQEILGPL